MVDKLTTDLATWKDNVESVKAVVDLKTKCSLMAVNPQLSSEWKVRLEGIVKNLDENEAAYIADQLKCTEDAINEKAVEDFIALHDEALENEKL